MHAIAVSKWCITYSAPCTIVSSSLSARRGTWQDLTTWHNRYHAEGVLGSTHIVASRCHRGHYRKTWPHLQNRKYIITILPCRNSPNHGHRQRAHKIWRNLKVWLLRYVCKQIQTVRLTDKQTNKQTDMFIKILCTLLRRSNNLIKGLNSPLKRPVIKRNPSSSIVPMSPDFSIQSSVNVSRVFSSMLT